MNDQETEEIEKTVKDLMDDSFNHLTKLEQNTILELGKAVFMTGYVQAQKDLLQLLNEKKGK